MIDCRAAPRRSQLETLRAAGKICWLRAISATHPQLVAQETCTRSLPGLPAQVLNRGTVGFGEGGKMLVNAILEVSDVVKCTGLSPQFCRQQFELLIRDTRHEWP